MYSRQFNGIQARGWLAWLVAIPVLIVAAVFGFFVLLAVLGLALVVVVTFALRLWWLKRRLRGARDSETIEGEYTVVRRRDDTRGKLR